MKIDRQRFPGGALVACLAVVGCGGEVPARDGRVGEASFAVNYAMTPAGNAGGTVVFNTDEYGASDPCCGTGNGVSYTLASGPSPGNVVCNMFVEVLEPSTSSKAYLTTCPLGSQPTAALSDTHTATTRTTTFQLTSVAGIDVQLVQSATANQLDRTYTLTDTSNTARSLVMVNFSDIDVSMQSGVPNGNGWMYNLGRQGQTPTSVEIMDDLRGVRVELQSSLGGATTGTADGYRVAQFTNDNETVDFAAAGTQGYPTTPGSRLNGLFLTHGAAPGNTSFAGEGAGDLNCDGLTDTQAPTVGESQWQLQIPASGTATFKTSMILTSGPDPITYGPSSCVKKCLTFQRGAVAPNGTVYDTQVSQSAPTQTYGNALVMNSGTVAGGGRDALLQFALAGVPASATIVSATLTVSVRAGYSSLANVNAHPVLVPWSEATETWNSFYAKPSPQLGAALPPPAMTQPSTSGPITFDLTSAVASWVSGAQPNYGVLLEQTSGSTSYWTSEDGAKALRPSLQVCYQ